MEAWRYEGKEVWGMEVWRYGSTMEVWRYMEVMELWRSQLNNKITFSSDAMTNFPLVDNGTPTRCLPKQCTPLVANADAVILTNWYGFIIYFANIPPSMHTNTFA